jgi:GTP-binding protein EngB required for normal cell division
MRRGISAILGSIFAERQKRKESSPLPEIELSTNGGGAGMYAPNVRTLMFESVLSRQTTADPGRGAAPARRNEKSGPSLSKKVAGSEDLRIAKETIAKVGQTLAVLSDAPTAEHIRHVLEVAEAQYCQIAFIGQMNAGKSTLINALIGTPNLLPSEITPWTTVVTNLYFGIPGKPTSGAVFEFFEEAEWRQLSEGRGRVRALTERFIPNFPWQNLHQQVSSMKEIAERRLGPRFSELLGKQHAFPSLDDGLLEKYVAAESPLGEAGGSAAGEFSTITKAAHIYFDLMSFFYPTVLIDTPGINDPFLVRDEITRQNLERANVFVIVVTARQPLSNADLNLLRILHGLRKDNFIIFVNKIDEIEDFERHADVIAGRIKTLLKREFPDADIPIIVGCAEWAAIALGPDVRKQQELARLHNFSRSITEDGARNFWLSDPAAEAAAIADTILTRSSIPDLAVAISNVMYGGPIAGSLRHAASALLALAKNGSAQVDAQIRLLRRLQTGNANDKGATTRNNAELVRGLQEATTAMLSIKDAITQVQARYADVIEHTKQDLVANLQDKLKLTLSFRKPLESPRGASSMAARSSLVSELRSAVESEFSRLFQEIVPYVSDVTQSLERKLSERINIAATALDIHIEYPHLPALRCTPSLVALGDPIATEFGGLAYAASWDRLISPERKQQYTKLLEAEFDTIINKLAQAARDELERTTRFIIDHFNAHALHPVEHVIEQRRTLMKELAGGGTGGGVSRDGGRKRVEDRLRRLEDDARAYEGVIAALTSLRLMAKE